MKKDITKINKFIIKKIFGRKNLLKRKNSANEKIDGFLSNFNLKYIFFNKKVTAKIELKRKLENVDEKIKNIKTAKE